MASMYSSWVISPFLISNSTSDPRSVQCGVESDPQMLFAPFVFVHKRDPGLHDLLCAQVRGSFWRSRGKKSCGLPEVQKRLNVIVIGRIDPI